MSLKNYCLLILFLTNCFTAYTQITFEPGYYVNNQGQKVTGLVYNEDWSNNPSSFRFKVNSDAKTLTKNLDEVKEFGVDNVSKYIRAQVDIDRSTDDIETMSTSRNPNFQNEKHFLNVLVQGNATLYKFKDGQLIRYFFKTNDLIPKQLIYKEYLVSRRKTAKNNSFHQQLFNQVNCRNQSIPQITQLDYTSKQLVDYFVKENSCLNASYTNYEANKMKADFNLYLKGGVNFSNLKVTNSFAVYRNTDFGSSIDPRFGIEAEVILPFNKGKWSLFTELYYEAYSAENYREGNSGPPSDYESSIDYESIGLPFAVRYYAFLNNKLSLYLNLGVQWHFDFDNEILFGRVSGSEKTITIKAGQTLFLGVGLNLNKRYAAELRYNTSRDLSSTSGAVASEFSVLTLSLAYKLF